MSQWCCSFPWHREKSSTPYPGTRNLFLFDQARNLILHLHRQRGKVPGDRGKMHSPPLADPEPVRKLPVARTFPAQRLQIVHEGMESGQPAFSISSPHLPVLTGAVLTTCILPLRYQHMPSVAQQTTPQPLFIVSIRCPGAMRPQMVPGYPERPDPVRRYSLNSGRSRSAACCTVSMSFNICAWKNTTGAFSPNECVATGLNESKEFCSQRSSSVA